MTQFDPSFVHSQPNATRYVLGFAFIPGKAFNAIVLIEKQKPEWQKGRLNGVGGKFEDTDPTIEYAMSREFLEETGHVVEPEEWIHFETMRFENGACVYCFAVMLPENAEVSTREAEQVFVLPVTPKGQVITTKPTINNLMWLVPKALHQAMEPPSERLVVH